MADPSTGAPSLRYDLLIGPLLIGTMVDTVVFGLCFMQAARYMLLNFQDGWKIRSLIAWVFILSVFQVASETSMMWHYTVANFINPTALLSFPWQYAAEPIFNALVCLPIQLFLARKVMSLSGSAIPAAIMSVLALVQSVLSIVAAARHLADENLPEPQTTTKISLIVSAASTVIIACFLSVFILRRQRKLVDEDGWTQSLGYYVYVFAASAIPSAVVAVLEVILFFSKPTTNLHVAFALPIARLYVTALLAILNERKQTRTQSDSASNKPISLGVLTQNRQAKPKTPVHITISQDVDVQMCSNESDRASASDKASPFGESPITPGSEYSYGKAQPMGLGY